jgi:hypothetical protein
MAIAISGGGSVKLSTVKRDVEVLGIFLGWYHREANDIYLPRIGRLNWESEMTEFGARSASGSTSLASSLPCCLLELPSHGPKRSPLCRAWQESWALRWVQEPVILSS